MSSRSNMPVSACGKWRPSWRAFGGRVETHILLNFLQTGARRAVEGEVRFAWVLYQGQGPPRDILGATDGYGRTCTDPACAAQPRGGRVGGRGARADAAARGSLVRGD